LKNVSAPRLLYSTSLVVPLPSFARLSTRLIRSPGVRPGRINVAGDSGWQALRQAKFAAGPLVFTTTHREYSGLTARAVVRVDIKKRQPVRVPRGRPQPLLLGVSPAVVLLSPL